MLTKDKKPFTYTPGGIDLSEIGSPRLARRIERNANAPGVGEVHTSSPPRGFTGTMPPAALAAMQPALQVQVFPSGPPPPPPPPPVHIPPPPPMGPLPTKSISTSDGVVERPDMTKIIPENPMALLRKTPKAPTSMADNINYVQPPPQHNQSNFANAVIQNKPQPVQPQNQYQPQVIQRQEPQVTPPAPKPQMVQRPEPRPQPQQQQPEMKTSTAQLGSLYIPPIDNQNKPIPQTPQTPSRNVSSPPAPPQRSPQSPSSPQSPMATLQKSPRPWQNQKPVQPEPAWVQRSQSPPQAPQRESPPAQSPPHQRGPQTPNVQRGPPQSPNVQSNVIGRVIIPMQMDGSPQGTNVEAVFITQPIVLQHPGPGNQQQRAPQQKVQQQQQYQQQQQQQLQQQQLQQQQLQQQKLQQQQLQQQQQQQQQRVQQQQSTQQRTEQKNIRIIPIQIEGASNNNGNNNVQRQESRFNSGATTPATATPGSARPFNRQPSWSQSGPTQSNAFKLIQKITNTDGDDDEDEEEVEHEPRNSQQFQQVPAEQVRKMKMTDDDRLMNKVKQGIDSELFLHNEPDPRYRGAAIPSKAFRLLQWMIDDLPPNMTTVPRNGQNSASNNANQVRMIPVQMEGETSGNYVPPSEQTVQEPKKYTGGKIPSRSFKILQAMTGDTCANETDPDPSCYGYPPIPPYIPPPIPPYWHNYWGYSPCPTPCDVSRTDSPNTTKCTTPTPFMRNRRPKDDSDTDTERSERRRSFPLGFRGCSPQALPRNDEFRGRSTPVHFRGCSPQAYRRSKEDGDRNRRSTSLPRTPPCWGYPYYPYVESEPETDTEGNGRSTPMNCWGGYSPFYPIPYSEYETDTEEKPRNGRTTPKVWDNDKREESYPPYPMYDPYYPPYYYYPMYPYPVYPPAPCDSDEFIGYSSTDEMNGYNKNYKMGDFKQEAPKPMPPKEEEQKPTPPKQEKQQFSPQKPHVMDVNSYEEDAIDVSKFKEEINSNTTKITIEYPETDTTDNSDYSDTDTEVEDTEENKYSSSNMSMGSLKAIRSVSDINVYSVDESNCSDEESEHLTEDEEASVEEMPHQLSVIYEESERSDLSRVRESSVASNDSAETIACGYQEDLLHEEQNMFNENEENQKISLMNEENARRNDENSHDEDTNDEDKHCNKTNTNEDIVIETNNNEWDEEDHDWWGELKTDDDVLPEKNKKLFSSPDDEATEDNQELPKEEMTTHTAVEETVTQEDAQADDVDFWSVIDTEPAKSKEVLVDVEKKLNLVQYTEQHRQEYISSNISLSSSTAGMFAQIEEITESNFEENAVHLEEESSCKYAQDTSMIEDGLHNQKEDQTVYSDEQKSVESDPSWVQSSYNSSSTEKVTLSSNSSINMKPKQTERSSVQEETISSKPQVKSSSTDLEETVTISSNSSSVSTELNQSTENTSSILEETISSKIQSFTSCLEENVMASSNSSSTCTKSTQLTGKSSSDCEEETISLKIKTRSLDLEDQTEESSTDSSSKSTVCSSPSDEKVEEEEVRMPSIKERIAALKRAAENKNKVKEEREIKGNVKEKITVLEEFQNRLLDEEIEIKSEENRRRSIIYERNNSQHEEDIVVVKESKTDEVRIEAREEKQSITVEVSKIQEDLLSRIEENLITKIEESLLSKFEEDNKRKVEDKSTTEENSEDEIDSGVTSDVSRHISDNEEVHEIRKMTKYQRAATHSRLFKLLQDECDNDEDEEVLPPKKETTIQNKKENLSLPLTKGNDSCDSSGINSPMSPVVNDKLVKDLVKSLLSRKKGRIFRGMPVEKLHNAAFKILQEELQMNHFNPEDVISPLRSLDSTPAQTPQEYYSEYNQYCDYWNSYEDYDVMPSKTFKLIQEHSTSNKTGSISGFLARCPRVLSSKNLYKDLISVLETRNCPDTAHPQPFEAQNGAS